MYTHRRLYDEREEQASADRQTASLVAFALVLILLIAGLFLVHRLARTAALEDCLMAGRSSCGMQAVLHP